MKYNFEKVNNDLRKRRGVKWKTENTKVMDSKTKGTNK